MATQTIKMVFQFRRATTAEWLQHKDVVPAAGEPCFDLDLNILKIGDGVKTYEQLEPISGAKLSADGKSIILTDGVFKLMGFDAAEIGAQPRKGANGEIEWFVPSTKDVDDLKTDVAGLKLDVANLQADKTTLLGKIEIIETKVNAVEGTIDAKINEFANQISDDGTVNTLKELISYVANHGGEVESIVNDIATLQGLVGSDPVKDQIAEAIANSGHMSNGIKEIAVNGALLDVVDGRVDINVPEFKSSDEIGINEDGTLSIKSISFDKIAQDENTVIIMDGGSAV